MLKKDKPNIIEYRDIVRYFIDLYEWKKKYEKFFSLRRATKETPRCSRALVSMVLKRKRSLSPAKAADFAKIFSLSTREKAYLIRFLENIDRSNQYTEPKSESTPKTVSSKSVPSNYILSHWLHSYVKDAAQLKGFMPEPEVIHRLLQGIASTRDIARSLAFLLREGYLRYTLDGKIVVQNVLHETTDEVPSEKIRAVHKKALTIASNGIETITYEEREACTFLLPLNHDHFLLLKNRIKEWAEEVSAMAEAYPEDDEMLYQMVIHLTPVGGLELSRKKSKEKNRK